MSNDTQGTRMADPERAMDTNETGAAFHRSNLEEYERADDTRPPFILTSTEAKLLGIAGVSPCLLAPAALAQPWHVRTQFCLYRLV